MRVRGGHVLTHANRQAVVVVVDLQRGQRGYARCAGQPCRTRTQAAERSQSSMCLRGAFWSSAPPSSPVPPSWWSSRDCCGPRMAGTADGKMREHASGHQGPPLKRAGGSDNQTRFTQRRGSGSKQSQGIQRVGGGT
jgi:hypothetical protein